MLRLVRFAPAASWLLGVALAVGTGGCKEKSVSQEKLNDLPPEVREFAAAKETQARALAGKLGLKVAPELWKFFEFAKAGKTGEALRVYEKLRKRAGQYEGSRVDPAVTNPVWQTALEVVLAAEAFGKGEPEFAFAYGRDIIASI